MLQSMEIDSARRRLVVLVLAYWLEAVASNQCGHVCFSQRNSIRLKTMDAARKAHGVHAGVDSPVAKK